MPPGLVGEPKQVIDLQTPVDRRSARRGTIEILCLLMYLLKHH